MYTVVNVNIHKNTKGNKSNGIQAIVLYYVHEITVSVNRLKVQKIENFFGFDFEFCTISLLVVHK
jgi:hypothetical protein